MAERALLRFFAQISTASLPRHLASPTLLTKESVRTLQHVTSSRHLSACISRAPIPISSSTTATGSSVTNPGRRHDSVLHPQSPLANLLRPPHRAWSSEVSDVMAGSGDRMMKFEDYRKLKKTLKLRARVAGLPVAIVGIIASSAINVHLNPDILAPLPEDEIKLILGMDPAAFAILCGLGSGIVGYLLGGALFNATWRLLARNKARQVQERDEDFLNRIQKFRSSNFNRFHDDYYGDKVMTLSDYRQWVRQQQEASRWDQSQQKEGTDEGTNKTEKSDSETAKL